MEQTVQIIGSGTSRIDKLMLLALLEQANVTAQVVEEEPSVPSIPSIVQYDPIYPYPKKRGRSKGERKRNPRWRRP